MHSNPYPIFSIWKAEKEKQTRCGGIHIDSLRSESVLYVNSEYD